MQGNSPQRHKVHGVNSEIVTTYFNKTFVKFALLVSSLCVLCASVVNLQAQDFKTIHDGVEYAEVNRKLGDDPVKINLLRLDLTKVRLDVHHAMDAAIGTEKTSSIATRHRAVAAINAGFFRLDKSQFAGDAAGLLMIDGKLLSEGVPGRQSLWVSNVQDRTFVDFYRNVLIGRVKIGAMIKVLSGINRERKTDELVLYTPEFGSATLTDQNGVEIVVANQRITKVVRNKGNNAIPRNGYVLSGSGKFTADLTNFKTREKMEFGTQMFSLEAYQAGAKRNNIRLGNDIVAGVPQLIKNGKIDITWEQEKSSKAFVETRHPRTAVAKLKDGKFLMITVDGRQTGVSVGMNLNELAEYLLSLGAVDAMNLDGGGSTTMFLDGKVVNKPSDKEGERKVGDAILVTLRKKK
jgi:exopolysaccharide biosynthesis protein